ncbi:MAG: hypothetical protein HND46_20960 [Chloroflexi bacterium]|nr:hypothetical protein [Chloroflexota bacterium]NOG65895.1 hypothetical protein [Chloroflexota bacterium]
MKSLVRFVGLTIIFSFLMLGLPTAHAQDFPEIKPVCFEFERLPLGMTYHVGDNFAVTGATVEAQEFQWADGTLFPDGEATVENGGMAGGSGSEIHTNNINLQFKLDTPVDGLILLYGAYGGNLNLEINGDFINTPDFPSLHGSSLGGVNIYVDDINGTLGRLILEGTIEYFRIGGQEFWFDDPCGDEPPPPPGECVNFESLALGSHFVVGDTFDEAGVKMTVVDFYWSSGVASGGFAEIGASGAAGGSGQELIVNNVSIAFDFGGPVSFVSLRFGEYGGNVNIEINGDFRNEDDFAKIHNQVIGGVTVLVGNGFGNDSGMIVLVGTVNTFSIGGQEFFIDEVCYCADGKR